MCIVQMTKNDSGLVFSSVLQTNCSFGFGFSITQLTAACIRFIDFTPLWCDARNDILPC